MKLMSTFFVALFTPGLSFAQGNDVPTPQVTEPKQSPDKDRLARYLLEHPEIKAQQKLLETLLRTDTNTETVFDQLPEKNKKEFKG